MSVHFFSLIYLKRNYLRIFLTICLSYGVFEFWAQFRYDLNNPHVPMSLRKNMGLNTYDAMKLIPNFSGWSGSGVYYKTDPFGFRVPSQSVNRSRGPVLLGGDSRIFGYTMSFEESVAGVLERKHDIKVYLQAFPGGCPSMCYYDMFEDGKFFLLPEKPKFFIYAYDRNDVYNDKTFEYQLKNEYAWYSPRRLKLMLGGYAWNMSRVKVRAFKGRMKQNEKTIQSKEQKSGEIQSNYWYKTEISTAALDKIFKKMKSLKVRSYLLYLPRLTELIAKNDVLSNQLKAYCESRQLGFIDGYKAFHQIFQGDIERMRPYFLDLREGIHFSAKGSNIIESSIMKELEKEI